MNIHQESNVEGKIAPKLAPDKNIMMLELNDKQNIFCHYAAISGTLSMICLHWMILYTFFLVVGQCK